MKKKKINTNDFLKVDMKRIAVLIKKQEEKQLENITAWMDVIENPENWEKLDIRVQQKSGQFKRLKMPKHPTK